MKKLILIQNDYPGTGKSTLSLCLTRHLEQYGVDHRLLSLVEAGRVNLKPLLTHFFALDEIHKAYRVSSSRSENVLKAAIRVE